MKSKPPARPSKIPAKFSRRAPPPRHQSVEMQAVRQAAHAIRSELTATPAIGTEKPGSRIRRHCIRMLIEAEENEDSATRKGAWRAIRELFEQMLGPTDR